MDAAKQASHVEARHIAHKEFCANQKEVTMLDKYRPLPVALCCQEITEQEVEALRCIAENPNATTGVLNWTPRRVSQRKHEPISK